MVTTSYTYNGFDQLTGVRSGGIAAAYAYNAKGVRTAKEVNGLRTSYLLDGGSVVGEIQNHAVTASYVWGANLISSRNGLMSDPSLRNNYYFYNAHGDVVQLVDDRGNITGSYDYDAFGNEKAPSGADSNPFRYCGEYLDLETGTYYLRARYYDPALGRFTQADTHWNTANMIYGDNPQTINHRQDALGLTSYTHVPQITAVAQSGNLYVYAVNNPIRYLDLSGSIITPANIIGGAIGAGGGVLLGTMVANYYDLTGWQRASTIAGFTVGGAALGWFAGPLVEKLTTSLASKMGLLSSTAQTVAYKAPEKVQPIIGNKLDYIFGKATGNLHNTQRSSQMLRQLQRIGIFDNELGRQYITQKITEAFCNAQSISQGNGRVLKEILLMGPNGGVKLQTIWEGAKLITIYILS